MSGDSWRGVTVGPALYRHWIRLALGPRPIVEVALTASLPGLAGVPTVRTAAGVR